MRKIIGLVGFIGSGKGTVGEHLVTNHGFQHASFASSLKDAVSAVFGWPRHLLEGDTAESRKWREQEDQFWGQKLGRVVTPRWVLQYIGTDVMRNHFHEDIWIWSLEKRLASCDANIVLTDMRFPNEIAMINRLGGSIWWVRRQPEPHWVDLAIQDKSMMRSVYPEIHSSEYEWLGMASYSPLDNNGTIDELRLRIDQKVR